MFYLVTKFMRYDPCDDFSSNLHLEIITFDRDEAFSQSTAGNDEMKKFH